MTVPPAFAIRLAIVLLILCSARAAFAQCPTRVDPSFIAALQHPAVKQTAWSMPPITAEMVKASGGLKLLIDAEQRRVDSAEAAIATESASQHDSDRLAMLRDDARLHREYLRMLRCHAYPPGAGAQVTMNVGGASVSVTSSGSRRTRNPASDIVNAFLSRPANEATQDKIRSERAANDVARQDFNTLQVDAPSAARFSNTELSALRSSLSNLTDSKIADEFAFLAGDTPKTATGSDPGVSKPSAVSPNSSCPQGALGFGGFCASQARLEASTNTYTVSPARIAGTGSQRAVRTMKAREAKPGIGPDPILEYFELGLEQEGPNGELFLESVGQAKDAASVWSAFADKTGSAVASPDVLFDLATHRPPAPVEDAITVGLRQLEDAMQAMALGPASDALATEMCEACSSATIRAKRGPRAPTAVAYRTLSSLLQ